MAPYEALYGRRCRTLFCWEEARQKKILGKVQLHKVDEMARKVKIINERLKAAQCCQKSYVDHRRKNLEFQEGKRVFVKISLNRGIVKHPESGN